MPRAQVGQGPAERALVARHPERLAHLAEYLALADHHGVQAAGHRQQVLDRAVLVVHVQVPGELGQRDPECLASSSLMADPLPWNLATSA